MLSMTLRDDGWEVAEADSYVTALATVADDDRFDVILADLWMPEPDMAALAALRAAVPRVMTSLDADHATELVAGVKGIDKVLTKGMAPHELAAALRG
jgi:DNA-binding response OmpR family regulator